MKAIEKALLQSVESLADDVVNFTSRLVAEPSTLGNEASVLKVMENELIRLGYGCRRVDVDPVALAKNPGFAPVPWSYGGRYNLVALRPADAEGGQSALFNGHLDVVSPEPLERWDRDPFQPLVADGWLYGRGSGDMKAGVAAMTYALKAVDAAGFGLSAQVILEAVIEEECSGNGALASRAAGFDAQAVLIPEPFGPTILTSQVGVCWFKVSLEGVSKHALDTQGGINAIEKSYPLIAALRVMEKQLNEKRHSAFPKNSHPANLNIGIISGGDWPSTVPAKAEFHCRQGFLPGTSFSEIRGLISHTIAQAAAADKWLAKNPPVVEFYGFRSQGHQMPLDLPAYRLLSDCQEDLTGQPAQSFESTATTDLRAFIHYGKGQATCFGPVAENIHAANERVNIESVIHTAKIYALFLARWCGLVD